MSEVEFPMEGSSANVTDFGYTVEARHTICPREICGKIYDDTFRQVKISKNTNLPGIPVTVRGLLQDVGLLNLEAAEALKWWFLSSVVQQDLHRYGWQVRILKHKVEYSYKVTSVSEENLTGREEEAQHD